MCICSVTYKYDSGSTATTASVCSINRDASCADSTSSSMRRVSHGTDATGSETTHDPKQQKHNMSVKERFLKILIYLDVGLVKDHAFLGKQARI